jgi:SSS family transporter
VNHSVRAQELVNFVRTDLPALPDPVFEPLIGMDGEDPVVFGGWLGDDSTRTWSEAAFVLRQGEWVRASGSVSSDVARPDAATAVAASSFFVIGGRLDGTWSTEANEITWSEDMASQRKLPDLPQRLRRPSATMDGQTLTVAGFVDSLASGVEVHLFKFEVGAETEQWDSIEPITLEEEGALTLAFQDGGLNLTVSALDRSQTSLYRHTALHGWSQRNSPPTQIDVRGAMVVGQAHVAYLSPTPPEELGIWSYSVITDTWVELGRLSVGTHGMAAVPVGSSLLISGSSAPGEQTSLARTEFEVGKRHFYWLDFLMVALYLAGMIMIGFYFSKRETGTEDFFVGGRKMPWWAVGFSLYATGTSAISFMAIPAKSYATDWLYLAQNAIGLVAIIPVALIIVPLIRRLSLTTTYEYLEMRFHVVIRLMGSILNMTYQLGARMSVVLFLPALALSAVTGIGVVTSIVFMGVIATLYTVLGGIKAVIWTDVVQVVVLLGGAFLCLVIIVTGIDGGLEGLMAVTTADNKFHMFDWRFDLTIPTVWLFLILATADTITWPRDQVMVQRVLSTKTAREAGFSVWTLAAIVIPGSVLFFSLGTALYGFYKVNPERLSPLLNLDATLPFFIAAELPAGVAGLIIAALFAASMSTLDSSMNSVSTLIVVDFYQRFKKGVTDAQSLKVAKWITVATGVFGTGFAILLTRFSLPSLWDTFIMLTGLLGGGFGGVYALGMFTRRTNWQGASVGIVASIIATLLVQAYTNIHVLLYVGVAVITCIVVGYLVSLLFPPQYDQLDGLTVFKEDNGGSGGVRYFREAESR